MKQEYMKVLIMVKKWNDILIEKLKDKKQAIAYLNAALENTKDGGPENQQLLLIALRNIAKAQGGFSLLSEKTGLARESLYRSLSKKGNPKITTLTNLISAMGFELKAQVKKID